MFQKSYPHLPNPPSLLKAPAALTPLPEPQAPQEVSGGGGTAGSGGLRKFRKKQGGDRHLILLLQVPSPKDSSSNLGGGTTLGIPEQRL